MQVLFPCPKFGLLEAKTEEKGENRIFGLKTCIGTVAPWQSKRDLRQSKRDLWRRQRHCRFYSARVAGGIGLVSSWVSTRYEYAGGAHAINSSLAGGCFPAKIKQLFPSISA